MSVLYLPTDDPPLARISTREQAAMIIAVSPAHARAVAEGRSKAIPAVLSHFDDCLSLDTSKGQNGSAGRQCASRQAIVALTETSTRHGQLNWTLVGQVLRRRQLELDYPPVEYNVAFAVAIERRVRGELYP